MKRLNEIIDCNIGITKLTPTGQGIATYTDGKNAGKKIFLWNALPGEIVTKAKLTKRKKSYDEGIALSFSKTSPHRVEPQDEIYLSTSPWQIMDESYEAEQKQLLLREMFYNIFSKSQVKNIRQDSQNVALDTKTSNQPLPTPVFHDSPNHYFYRNKMEYSLFYNKETGKIELSFHERGSHNKIPIKSSSLERPEIFKKAQEIVEKLNLEGREAREFQSLLLRCDQTGKVEGGLYENHKPHPIFDNLSDSLLGYAYSYSPNGFFQINLPVYEETLKKIQELLANTDKVLDLYSGVGTIGLSIARDKELTLVEVDKSAYRELENNCKKAQAQSTPKITPILAKSEEVLDYITPDSTVILDPPRAGCDKKLIEKLLEIHPRQIIYLSCNPATQARDLELLLGIAQNSTDIANQKTGSANIQPSYHLNSIDIFNFFPRTPHIECLVSLT